MTVMLLIKQNMEFLSLKGGCTGSSESIPFKMPHCWKSHVVAHISKGDLPYQSEKSVYTLVLLCTIFNLINALVFFPLNSIPSYVKYVYPDQASRL